MDQVKKDINLIPKEELEASPIGKFLKWALTFGRYIVIFTELIVIVAFLFRFKLDRDLIKINSEIEEKQAIILSYQELEHDVRLVQERLELIKEITNNNLYASLVLEELARILPLDLVVDELSLSSTALSLEGKCLSKAGLATLIYGLQTEALFSQINIDSISSKGQRGSIITFSLSATIEKQ